MNIEDVLAVSKIERIYSKEDKILHWGEGEWADEPDLLIADLDDYQLKVMRMGMPEPNSYHWFGGYLCGYVRIPKKHPWYKLDYHKIDAHVHGGLTFSQTKDDGEFWIGFDCAHMDDLVPSTEIILNRIDKINKYSYSKERLNFLNKLDKSLLISSLYQPIYRNISFVINELLSLIEQAKEANLKTK